MYLTGLILLIGASLLFTYRAYGLFSIRRFIRFIPKEQLKFEYEILVISFIIIAISAGMVWS